VIGNYLWCNLPVWCSCRTYINCSIRQGCATCGLWAKCNTTKWIFMPVTSTRQPVWNEGVARGLICLIAFGRSAVKVVHPGIMGVHRNFSRGTTSTFRLSFFRLRTMQHKWTFTKRLPFLHTKKIPHENTRSVRIFETVSRWSCRLFEFAKRYFLASFTAFAELGYHPISLLLSTADNCVWIGLELSTTALVVLTLGCAGWTSLFKI